MEKRKIGIISAPDLPASQAEKIQGNLAEKLAAEVDNQVEWRVEVVISPLTGSAENIKDIFDEAKKLLQKYDWEYAICLSDLPSFSGKNVVLAESNVADGVALISLPAFGAMPTTKRIRKATVHMVKELYYWHMDKDIKLPNNGIGPLDREKDRKKFQKIKEAFHFSIIRRIHPPGDNEEKRVRFIIWSRISGLIRVLFGMAVANRPWTIMPSFKGVVALAFATGAYGLIFPTLWKLSVSYELPRFFIIMIASILAMIVWIVLAHDLWEKPNKKNNNNLRRLFNAATIMTLTTSILMYYVALFALFLVAVTIFVPPGLFSNQTGQEISILNYFKLAWLATSVSTAAGAIGSGLEKTDEVRKMTYGYRQYIRYEQIKQEEKKEEQKKYGKSNDD